jgi:hypothetical protein
MLSSFYFQYCGDVIHKYYGAVGKREVGSGKWGQGRRAAIKSLDVVLPFTFCPMSGV